ncbi:cell division protein ZapE [Aliiruegeria sabulilitoris]|uniref:cell division protein ZapE n=1 Tax=Aliiruegeria sabulilitoris TaxID=1510458 RepID=UPI000834904B|nr:cell division protein ZapE [Aliiruegeria sabulilitoris]NDR55528.1 AFG1 family ATPase [Pseudoruegeria sp. M32A2M]
MTETLIDIYNARSAEGLLTADAAQAAALPELERVRHELAHRPVAKPKSGLRGLFSKPVEPDPVRGLYLWGGVGRGKSMLMDMFFEAARTDRKRRVHFHAFMQEVHAGLHEARKRGVDDAILPVADEVIAHVDLLCFDEMQISDITDAMIVGRLFERLFAAGVVVVTTSNRVPDDLYKDGLNRQLFLPFIEMIKTRMVVHELTSDKDYRQDRLSGSPVYFTPNNHAARLAIQSVWDDLSGGDAPPLILTVKARPVEIPAFRNGVARAGFFDLCGHPLGPADYLAIAEVAKVLVLTDIPCLGRSNFNEAKRFVTLVDALYEAKAKLICSAAAEPELLYLEGEGIFEFERTASRLREMQSADWMAG